MVQHSKRIPVTHLTPCSVDSSHDPDPTWNLRKCRNNDADMQEVFSECSPAYLMHVEKEEILAQFSKCYLNQTTASSKMSSSFCS